MTHITSPDDFANNLLLFRRIEESLSNKLKVNPESSQIIYNLAECKRKLGDLDGAIALYKQLNKSPSNFDYSNIINALSGTLHLSELNKPNTINTCPLYQWRDFLPETNLQAIFEYINKNKNNFVPARIGKGKANPNTRNNTQLKFKNENVHNFLKNSILEKLPAITKGLGLSKFEISRFEIKLRAYHHGEFFKMHHDGGNGRLISFVYFFHLEPKRFHGGELITFDTNTVNSTFNHSFSRIIPRNNCLFLFPSNYYHAVLPVKTFDNSFLSARFAINGHLWQMP